MVCSGGGENRWQTAAFGCAVHKKRSNRNMTLLGGGKGGKKTALTFEAKGRKARRMGIMHELPAADVSAADSQR